MTPVEVFDAIREKAVLMLQTTLMESGKAQLDDETMAVMKSVLGIGIAAASEYYGANPETLAMATAPICVVCRAPVQTLQLGVDPAASEQTELPPIMVAWPCGHLQKS